MYFFGLPYEEDISHEQQLLDCVLQRAARRFDRVRKRAARLLIPKVETKCDETGEIYTSTNGRAKIPFPKRHEEYYWRNDDVAMRRHSVNNSFTNNGSAVAVHSEPTVILDESYEAK